MSKLEIATVYGVVVGFASLVFMAIVFYNESIMGRGVLYFEPNRALAFGELCMTVLGGIFLGFLLIALVAKPGDKPKGQEPAGYPKSDGVYQ